MCFVVSVPFLLVAGVDRPLSRKARMAWAVSSLAACPQGAWAEALEILEDPGPIPLNCPGKKWGGTEL